MEKSGGKGLEALLSSPSPTPTPHFRHNGHHHPHENNSVAFLIVQNASHASKTLRGPPSAALLAMEQRMRLSPPPPFNMTKEEFFDYFNWTENTTQFRDYPDDDNPSKDDIIKLYKIIIPIMVFFCILTAVVNLVIVLSSRWCRKPMSPTLYFSISLALADAYATIVIAIGLVVNSYLPVIYDVQWENHCFTLTLEACRLGGILVTVSHLLALAINHWIGIVRPLHYPAMMTRRTAWIVIIISWIFPILILLVYFSAIEGEGFRSPKCMKNHFMSNQTFRTFFASCFFAPLILMSLIYLHIFLIVRDHHSHRRRYQSSQQLRRNVKATVTTVLILGTYIIGWMPATIFNIVVCEDCSVKFKDIPKKALYPIAITLNFLVILKAFLDPIIYAARMSDIQAALKKMRYALLHMICGSFVPYPPTETNERGLSKFQRSLYDTKSMRMSSIGSGSSTRRTGNHVIANSHSPQLLNNSHSHNKLLHNGNHIGTNTETSDKAAFEMTELH